MKTDILDDFFSLKTEKAINDNLLYYSYVLDRGAVAKYISDLISIPISDYVDYLIAHYNVTYLESKDVFQFSCIADFTTNICKKIKEAGDKGFEFLEIGRLLENDGILRKNGAYLKYGENHSKSAAEIGLLFSLSCKYFLSCIGYVFNEMGEKEQADILTRLFLRNKLIKRLIYKWKTTGSASYSYETGFLSESTQTRRRCNVKKIVEYLKENSEHFFDNFAENCHFE